MLASHFTYSATINLPIIADSVYYLVNFNFDIKEVANGFEQELEI